MNEWLEDETSVNQVKLTHRDDLPEGRCYKNTIILMHRVEGDFSQVLGPGMFALEGVFKIEFC